MKKVRNMAETKGQQAERMGKIESKLRLGLVRIMVQNLKRVAEAGKASPGG